jgi:hypothetical protein
MTFQKSCEYFDGCLIVNYLNILSVDYLSVVEIFLDKSQ